MKNRVFPLVYLSAALVCAARSFAAPQPEAAAGVPSVPALADVPYEFDAEKLSAARDPFGFFRSFVGYFYLLARANKDSLRAVSGASGFDAWCAGDAHPENFGALLLGDGTPVFSSNDPDDSGPCPAALDLYRLMVSSLLYSDKAGPDKLAAAYAAGLRGEYLEEPAAVRELLKKSRKKGFAPDPDRVSGRSLVRRGPARELDRAELEALRAALSGLKGALSARAELLDAYAYRKKGGGSGGLLRYEALLDDGGRRLHLEFKEISAPAILPVAAGELPAPAARIMTSLALSQGPGLSPLYRVAVISGKEMLLRPRFGGNIGVSLDKGSGKDNRETIRYEAYALGRAHARSMKEAAGFADLIEKIPSEAWEEDAALMAAHFERKFAQLGRSAPSAR